MLGPEMIQGQLLPSDSRRMIGSLLWVRSLSSLVQLYVETQENFTVSATPLTLFMDYQQCSDKVVELWRFI